MSCFLSYHIIPSVYRTGLGLGMVPSVQGPGLTPSLLVQLEPHCTAPPNMFKLVQLGSQCRGTPTSNMNKLLHYVAHTVGKWVVSIQLKCLLATDSAKFSSSKTWTVHIKSDASSVTTEHFFISKIGFVDALNGAVHVF